LNSFIKFKLLRPGARLPKRGTEGSGAFDFYAPEDGRLEVGEKRLIPSGVAHEIPGVFYLHAGIPSEIDSNFIGPNAFELPFKIQGVLFDRSGLGGKKGVRLSFACLIDNDYRGEILISLENQGTAPLEWKQGDRLCQIAYVPMYAGEVEETETLTDTHRGAGGFGSTGR
jgi:dUTP pyrophosphatase